MNIDAERSPLIQNLIRFVEADDESKVADACESPPSQTSALGEAEDLPTEKSVPEAKGSDRTAQPEGLPNADSGAPSAGILERVLKLSHKLRLKKH